MDTNVLVSAVRADRGANQVLLEHLHRIDGQIHLFRPQDLMIDGANRRSRYNPFLPSTFRHFHFIHGNP